MPPPAPVGSSSPGYTMVFGMVVGIYIDDAFIGDGLVHTGRMRPIARLGYMDYSVLTPESHVHAEPARWPATTACRANWSPGAWDGVFR